MIDCLYHIRNLAKAVWISGPLFLWLAVAGCDRINVLPIEQKWDEAGKK
jgi:hypothetical protein